MSTDVSVDTVLQAIDALYLNPDNNVKEQASKWLCSFQNSIFAWEIADKLLYLNRDLHSSYFGAQTMRIKIQCRFTELPISSHEPLKDSLLEHVAKLTPSLSVPITNQLCLAVADMFCHMVQWKQGIKDIIDRLHVNETSCLYLIEILKFIPEEMTSSTLRLGLNRRLALMSQLEESKGYVLDFLSQKIKCNEMPILTRIFNCLTSWWDNTEVMTENDLQVSPLLETAFYILQNPTGAPDDTYDSASQWIRAILHQLRNFARSNSSLFALLQSSIYQLAPVLSNCAQAVSSNPDLNQLELYKDRCMCLAHIFSSLARTLRSALVNHPAAVDSGALGDLRTLECLLAVLELPEPLGSRQLVSVTFRALISLADDASRHSSLSIGYGSEIGSGAQPNVEPPRPITALVPYFKRVVVALTRFCPSNFTDLESADELRDFRDDVHDLMQDILGLVGAESIFVALYNHVQQLQSTAVVNNVQTSPSELLRESEACIFMLTTVAKRLSPLDPEGHISTLISRLVLPGLAPPCPHPLQEVGCLLYMKLAHWAACHPELRRQIVNQLILIVERAANVDTDGLEVCVRHETIRSLRSVTARLTDDCLTACPRLSPDQPGQKMTVATALSALGSLCSVYRATPSATGFLANEPVRAGLLDEHWDDLMNRVIFNLPRLAWAPIYDAKYLFTGIGYGLLASVGIGGGGVEAHPEAARTALPDRLAQVCSVSLECLTKTHRNLTNENCATIHPLLYTQLIEGNVPIGSSDSLTDPRVWLDYLAAVFRPMSNLLKRLDLSGGSACSSPTSNGATTGHVAKERLVATAETCLANCLRLVRQRLWPVISRVLAHYACRSRPMEHTCTFIRFLVRCFSVHLHDLLPDIAQEIVLAFTNGCQQSSFLYLAGVLVDVFGGITDCRVGLVQVYTALAGPTLRSLDGAGLAQQPHTVEDLYRLCTRLVQHCPAVFLTCEQMNLDELCATAVRSVGLAYTTHSSNDDSPGRSETTMLNGTATGTGDIEISSSDKFSATEAAAHFLIDLLAFTAEASEVTSSTVVRVMSAGGQLPTPTCPSSLAAQRVLIWLICGPAGTYRPQAQAVDQGGGQLLVSAVLQSCCFGLSERRFEDLAAILHHLKAMMKNQLFSNWLTTAVQTLPVLRSDGLVHATVEQINDFKSCVTNSTQTREIELALESFASLFC